MEQMENELSSKDECPQLPVDTCSRSVVATEDQYCIDQEPAIDSEHREADSECTDQEDDPTHTVTPRNKEALKLSEVKHESLPDRSLEDELNSEHVNNPHQESPILDDRNLEQFSEVLLDSDSSVSNHEVTVDDKQYEKRVRFADEVGETDTTQGIGMMYSGLIIHHYSRKFGSLADVRSTSRPLNPPKFRTHYNIMYIQGASSLCSLPPCTLV